MKFAEGHWVMRRGVRAAYAADAYETRVESERLTIIAATQILKNRGMTIGGPTITLRISSPLAGSVSRRRISWAQRPPSRNLRSIASGRRFVCGKTDSKART